MRFKDAQKPLCALLASLCLANGAFAELREVNDAELGEITGQAVVAFDITDTADARFTRLTLGLETEFQINTDEVVLGEYADPLTAASADLDLRHLSFGHIARADGHVGLDGKTYNANDIVPFLGNDPYMEIAAQGNDILGIRFGFNQALGSVSGDFQSFSGAVGMQILDSTGTPQAATLFDASGVATDYRATHIGLSDAATDCATGIQCTALSQIGTFDVGKRDSSGGASSTGDFFIAVQREGVDWQSADNAGGVISAAPGVFLSLPTAMQLDIGQLEAGVQRQRTEYIDRGLGLF